jgi:Protein of unknown function (DUF3383)
VISQSRYIKIISGVGAGASVAQRQLAMRAITQNSELPPGVVGRFANSDSVGAYFGMQSEEYKRSLPYFGFISKSIKSPQSISFARWANEDIAPLIVGDTTEKNLADFTSQTAATLTINSSGTAVPVGPINLSTANSLTGVASMIQTAAIATADTQLASCTVTYNTNTNQFTLTGSVTGVGTLAAVSSGLGTDLSIKLGWATTGATNVPGQTAVDAATAVQSSAQIDNNFGSFVFCTPAVAMTNLDIAAIAEWNHAQDNMYLYSVPVLLSNIGTLEPLVVGYSGCALNILSATKANDFVEQSPCEILAATDYGSVNATQNYMYYAFPSRNVTVTDDPTADQIDALRGNYIGATQSAGQTLAFYQRGVLCGGPQAAVDMNTYANEMWMKSAITAQLMSLFLNVPIIPANAVGQAQIFALIQSVIDAGKDNGVIPAGKPLDQVQQQYITQISGDANAWRQVSTIGYWLNVTFTSYTNPNNNLIEWKANYLLIYAKNDAIRLVEGSDVLI